MRVRVGDLARMALSWAISSVALVVAADLLPGLSVGPPVHRAEQVPQVLLSVLERLGHRQAPASTSTRTGV
jgi:hypothetical protein